jgi:hypothetical protein
MKSWFDCVVIAPPPENFECILNEPIWFNRFLYLKTDSVRGRILAKATEMTLIDKGFKHLSDLLSPSFDADRKYWKPWLTEEEAMLKTGSIRLANCIMSVIDLIPISWSKLVSKQQREPFFIGDWVINRNESHVQPCYVFRVVSIIPRKITATQYAVDHVTQLCSRISSNDVAITLQKSQIVKACILSKSKSNQDNESVYFYGGNYASSKLLLSQISWNINSLQYPSLDF